MLIAHGPLAAISSYYLFKKEIGPLTKLNKFLIIVSSFFIGILPDFDIFYLITKRQSVFSHHGLITHTPIFWIATSLMLYFFTLKIFKQKQGSYTVLLVKIFFVSTIFHILSDTLTGYIQLLYPLSNHYFTLFGNLLPNNLFSGYIGNPIFGLEIIIFVLFFKLLINQFLPKLNIITLLLLVISSFYFIFNIFVFANTYQVNTYTLSNGGPVTDQDSDGLVDGKDYDVNNNFVNNFDEVKKEELVSEVKDILSINPQLLPRKRNLWQNTLYTYGGLDIERLVFQAYQQLGSPLSPVVWDYMSKNNLTYQNDSLYTYLHSTNSFMKIFPDEGEPMIKRGPILPGSLIIIKSDDSYSLGIYLSSNNILFEDENGMPVIRPSLDIFEINRKKYDVFIQY